MSRDRTRGRVHTYDGGRTFSDTASGRRADVRAGRGIHSPRHVRSNSTVPIRLEPSRTGYPERDPALIARAHRSRSRSFRNRRARRMGPFVGFGLLLASTLTWAAHSRSFAIECVKVQGTALISGDQVRAAAGVRTGDSLLMVSTRALRKRLTRIAPIQDIQLRRQFPHTLMIRVTEKQPWAALVAGGKTFLIDRNLEVISTRAGGAHSVPLVILSAARPEEIPAMGSLIKTPSVIAALGCVRRAQEPSSGLSVARVFIDAKREIWLNANGTRARFGQPERLGAKLGVLRSIVRGAPKLLHEAEVLDLQNPNAPAYVPRPENPPTRGPEKGSIV